MASARRPVKRVGRSVHEVQAAAEGVDLHSKVSLNGAEFLMADRIGLAPMILLAVAGQQGVDSNDPRGLVALHDVITDCLDADEHERFWRHAVATKADGDDLMAMVKTVIETLSARPTGPPSGSSPGRRRTSASSKASLPQTDTGPDDGMISADSLLGH